MRLRKLIEELDEEISQLYEKWKHSGSAQSGDIWNQIKDTEKKRDQILKEINHQEARSPNNWNVQIYVLTNYKKEIKENLGRKLARNFPEERNSDEKLEHWIPYLESAKTIEFLLNRFKKEEKCDFEVFFFNGFEKEINWSLKIDDAVVNENAVAIIDLLALNSDNDKIAIRFDTAKMKSTILPICTKLHDNLKEHMKNKQKVIFPASNERLQKGLCCYFNRISDEDYFIQELRKVYPSFGRTRNNISDSNISDKDKLSNSISIQ